MELQEQNNFKCFSWKTVDLESRRLEMMERYVNERCEVANMLK